MRKWLPFLLIAALTVFTACSGKQTPKETSEGPTLADVRQQAQLSLDGTLPSKERQLARDKAMSLLVSLLRQPGSVQIPKSEWEQPFKAGEPARLHMFESGKVRAYGLTLPGSGIVPPGERVALQFAGAVAPQAYEVEVMPGGQLVGARMIDDRSVALVFGLARGGGYVGYYVRDSRTDEPKADSTAFRGIPATVGDVRLEPRGNFLVVDVPVDSDWSPSFDKTHLQRFYLNADVGLEWKSGKFTLVDERNFTAFQGFVTAADTSAKKEDRLEAWDKAIRKLPAYLQSVESLTDQFLPKLPKGAREQIETTSNLTARVVSVPAPEGLGRQSFSVIQHRVGNGMPMATVLNLPGPVEAVKALEVDGLPGLEIVSESATGHGRTVTLLRITGSNDWEPAPDWFGTMPVPDPGLKLQLGPGPGDLTIEPDDPKNPAVVTLQADKSVLVSFNKASRPLVWYGGRLSGGSWMLGRVQQIAANPSASAADVLVVANEVKQFLLAPESAALSATNLAAMTGSGVLGWDTGAGSRVLAFPPNASGLLPLLVQSGKTVLVESYTPQTVTQWLGAREVQAGGQRWLLALGRTTASASVVLYQWSGDGWQPANALDQALNQVIVGSARAQYTPGQTSPIRGLYVQGTTDLKANFTPDGSGVQFCVTGRPCAVYQYATSHWVLK